MLDITYQVLGVDWPLTLSAKIDGHVTWVLWKSSELLMPGLECCFHVGSTFPNSYVTLKIQMIFTELITVCPLSIQLKLLPKYLNLGVVPPCEEGDSLTHENDASNLSFSLSMAATLRMSINI